jgi:hypothetical protein
MMRVFRWLNPNTPLRGLAFGLVFGFVGVQALFIALSIRDDFHFKSVGLHLLGGLCYAVPWVIIWGMSGVVCKLSRSHLGTVATGCAFAFGIGYSFWEGPKHLHPWLLMTVPFYTFLFVIPCYVLAAGVAAVLGWIGDPEEAE